MKNFIFVFLILALGLINAEKFRFNNYKLVRITPLTEEHLKLLEIFENDSKFDVWNGIKGINNTVDVSLSPQDFEIYKTRFLLANIPFKVINENIQDLFDEQERSMNQSTYNTGIIGKYAKYNQIISYLKDVVNDNPDIASCYSAGTTYERRELRVIVLKTSTSSKNIWIDCGIHAREWASPSTCIYFVDKLIREYRNNDPETVALLNQYEFHILPLVNPDGYEYTFTGYRLWRKNRKPISTSSCVGVDLNRNFGFKWMVSGSSNQPCNDIYAGPSPDSELETQGVENAIKAASGRWEQFYTLHSYGGFWMPPWGYTSVLPDDYNELSRLAKVATDAVKKVAGLNYKIGPPHMTVSYSASGGSYDWAKALHNVKYAYALELRPAQGTAEEIYGFALPEDRAAVCGEETYAGLKAIMTAIKNK